jgi:hypothetical protein
MDCWKCAKGRYRPDEEEEKFAPTGDKTPQHSIKAYFDV